MRYVILLTCCAMIGCLAVAGCGEDGQEILQDLVDLNDAVGVLLDDIGKINEILYGEGVDTEDLQDAAEIHVATVQDDVPVIEADIVLPDEVEEELPGDSCCTSDGACPLGNPGVPLDLQCECILGNRMFAGLTCERP